MSQRERKRGREPEREPDASANGGFDHLLEFLRNARGFDFASYKRAGLMRRVQKRMETVGVKEYPAYVDYLEVHPAEFEHLFNAILINVTSFFRDAPVWDYLREQVLPRLLEAAGSERPIRVWSAACATGEEPYGLAMLFAEAMGLEAACRRVKVYATDVDEDAMAKGRQAVYAERDLADVDAALREKYFERTTGDRFAFKRDLRRCVIFGRNDLFQDAPISRVDLLVCRNALMYFNAEAQDRILARFHFALADPGFLVLGKAETLLTRANLFTPEDLRLRVFRKVPRMNVRDRLLMLAKAGNYSVNLPPPAPAPSAQGEMQDASFEANPVAQIVLGLDGSLALANDSARVLFGLTSGDLGRPLQDLEVSYRPVELRSLLDQVRAGQRPVVVRDVEWAVADQTPHYFDIQVDTLLDSSGAAIGMSATYTDVTSHHHARIDLTRSKEELEAAYEELQSTGEELETTNEELQSTVEELETTNEELQSTNEELETMNEELQSTNEELQTMNDELRLRTDELNEVNGFMGAILGSLQLGVVVVDGELRVRAWNPRAEDLWGLRAEEVQGKFLLNLDIGLPVEKLRQPLRDAAAGSAQAREILLPATNRRGRAFQCRVTFGPLAGGDGRNPGVVLLMDEYAPADGAPRDGDGDGKGTDGG